MVTFTSDLSLRGQRSKKGLEGVSKVKVSNCSSSTHDQVSMVTPSSDLKGSKVRERSDKDYIFNFVQFQRLMCQIVLLVFRGKGQKKV